MAEKPVTDVSVRLVLENEKALRALKVIIDVLEDVAEDFAYRTDVPRAVKAAKYLMNNIGYAVDEAGAETLLASGEVEVVDNEKCEGK